MRSMRLTAVLGFALSTLVLTQCGGGGDAPDEIPGPANAAMAPVSGDWPMYRHDLGATGYSPLGEITAANVSTLTEAWSYSLAAVDEGARGPNSQMTPIVVDGVMYGSAADRRGGVSRTGPVATAWHHASSLRRASTCERLMRLRVSRSWALARRGW